MLSVPEFSAIQLQLQSQIAPDRMKQRES